MEKETSTTPELGNNANLLLSAGYSYKIGKFQVILDEDTEELKVIVCTNKDRMMIKPNTDNSSAYTNINFQYKT